MTNLVISRMVSLINEYITGIDQNNVVSDHFSRGM
jgi:hypothetical protein